MSDSVVVIGAGGHAKVVLATLEALEIEVSGIFDDNSDLWGMQLLGVEIKGPIEEAQNHGTSGVLALGANRDRQSMANQLSLDWKSAVHPSAQVHTSVELGSGTVIFAGAIVQPETVIGDHVIVNTGARIDHDCRIRSFSHIAPGASLAGAVSIGEGVLMGIGSCAVPGVTVGEWSVVGAGAAVVGDLAPGVTATGVPARVFGGDRS
jgi:sugar O-acyltransferase (sialic acid O-acetyltransferase NeuD family)